MIKLHIDTNNLCQKQQAGPSHSMANMLPSWNKNHSDEPQMRKTRENLYIKKLNTKSIKARIENIDINADCIFFLKFSDPIISLVTVSKQLIYFHFSSESLFICRQ